MFWEIAMIVIFFTVTIAIGIYCRRKTASVGDFVLGGRAVGPWLTAFAYGTSYFSAVVFVGYAGQFGWSFGLSAAWIGIGNALIGSLLAWVILGRRTRIMSMHLGSSTMPDFFEKRYDSKNLKIAASIITFIFLIPYSASVYKGLSGLFAMAFGIDFTYCIIGMAIITAVYVVIGGYMATAINDFIQGLIMLVGIVLIVLAVLNGKGGFTQALEFLSAIPSESAPNLQGAFVSMFGPEPLNLLSVFVLTSLGTWGLPQMVHKFYAIKNEQAIKTGTVISTLFALIIAGGSYFMGGFGRIYYTPSEDGKVVFDEIVPAMLSHSLPDILIGVVLILVLSASMSTLSSLVITSSSTFILDFVGSFMKKKESENSTSKKVLLMRIMCAVFVLLSVILALNPTSLITSLMSLSWGVLAGAFLGPFVYGLFWKRSSKAGVAVTMLCGIAIPVINVFIPFVSPLAAGAISIVASLIIMPIISLITPKMDKKYVENAFSCYNIKTNIPLSEALPDDVDEIEKI